jgi:hypothetical protein
MTSLTTRQSRPSRFFPIARTRLFWCKQFHQKWRRRVALLAAESDASAIGYKVQCLKCGATDIETSVLQNADLRS